MQHIKKELICPIDLHGERCDQALSQLLPDFSRTQITQWIKQGTITFNGSIRKPKEIIKQNDLIKMDIALTTVTEDQPEAIQLEVIHEDDAILVINKPAGLVVHPAAGNFQGTLLNALLHHCPDLKQIPRAGIIHRLDKDTSGLLVVTKTLRAHHFLVKQLQARNIEREYQTIVLGYIIAGGIIDKPIGRHPHHRTKMAVVSDGKLAVTHYRLLKRFKHFSFLQVALETGRTHQIRVHMSYIGHPIFGDAIYGGKPLLAKDCHPEVQNMLSHFPRQALHAKKLGLTHPETHEYCEWEIDLPHDIQAILTMLEKHDR